MGFVKNIISTIYQYWSSLWSKLFGPRLDDDRLELRPLSQINRMETLYDNLELKSYADLLITRGWGSIESLDSSVFTLDSSSFSSLGYDEVVQKMLNHGRKIAKGFQIPYLIPRVDDTALGQKEAGKFIVDEEGYVSISINSLNHYPKEAIYAILAHEVFHYMVVHQM